MDSWRGWSHASDPYLCASFLAIFLLSALIVWLSIRYANRRSLVDRPGPRRSHTQVTPRGGGVGIVLAALAMCWLPLIALPYSWPFDRSFGIGGAFSMMLVAGVGWIDDHRALSARIRIFIHFVAALLFLLWPLVVGGAVDSWSALWMRDSATESSIGFAIAVVLAMTLAVAMVWSINLHNFMDGINGLLACQAVFVFVAMGILFLKYDAELARWMFLFAFATLGFLPFNFPRARIFMGDVGSGALGFLIAVTALMALQHGVLFAIYVLIVNCAFVTDATCTLLSRMLRGRRWYSAHREHLYQWLVRCGFSHAKVVGLYMGWNLFIVAPVLYLVNLSAPLASGERMVGTTVSVGTGWTLVIYAFAIALWIGGKRWCLRKVKNNINKEV